MGDALDSDTDVGERLLDEFLDGMSLARREDEIVRRVLLQHPPHTLDVILGVSPVSLRLEVTKVLSSIVSREIGRTERGRTRQSC